MLNKPYFMKEHNKVIMKYSLFTFTFLAILLVITALIIWPLLVIFAMNTLFPALAISYTFWTWLAVVILNMTYLVPRYRKGE